MSEELLIENENRQEVSNFKRTIASYLKKWPYLLISILFCYSIAYIMLQFKQNQYNVTSQVIIKKNAQIVDPTEVLFGGGNLRNRQGGVGDEMIKFQSFPLIKSTLNELNFDVVYKVKEGWNEVEVYKQSPIIFDFDRNQKTKTPYNNKFIISVINSSEFKLTALNNKEEKLLDGIFKFDRTIDLNGFKFQINRSLSNWDIYEKETFVYLKSIINESYSYKGRIDFKAGEGISSVLTLSLKTKTPEKSIDFINTLVNKYIEKSLEEKNKVANNTVSFIDKQLAVIRDSLSLKEENLETFKSSEDMTNLTIEGEALISNFNEIETERAQYEVLQQYYDYLKTNIEDGDKTNLQNLIVPSAFGIDDDIINNLVITLMDLNGTKAQLLENGNDKNPLILQIDNKIEQIKTTLNESLENLSNANEIILSTLNRRSKSIIDQAKKLPNTERQLVNLNRLLKLNENIYLFLMEKRSSAAITLSSNTPDCKVIEPAMLNPLGPISPNRKMFYMIAILLGIILPLIIFILLDFLNNKIRDKEEVKSMTNIPIMGIIPESKNIYDNKIVFDQPKSSLAEAFRTIRTNLTFFQKNRSPFVILVTSTVAKEGKTFCAINLAASLAASGKRTILLGFDLRKPQIHNYLNVVNKAGVSNYLTGHATLNEVIQSTEQKDLFVISSGSIPPNPAELITTSKTQEFIAELKQQFDFIIIDTPPIGLVADALLLQRESDLNLYIVRQDYSKKEFLNQANDLYNSSKIENLSLVLNGVDQSSSYNYGYYEDEKRGRKKGFFSSRRKSVNS